MHAKALYFAYVFSSGCTILIERERVLLVLLETILHIIGNHYALTKLSALDLRPIHSRMCTLWKTHFASILITAWKVLNPTEFNYVFRIYFVITHQPINKTHLGKQQEKNCKTLWQCPQNIAIFPIQTLFVIPQCIPPTLTSLTGSCKYLWKCVCLLIWGSFYLQLFLIWCIHFRISWKVKVFLPHFDSHLFYMERWPFKPCWDLFRVLHSANQYLNVLRNFVYLHSWDILQLIQRWIVQI